MLIKKTKTWLRQIGEDVIIDLSGDVTNQGQETIYNAYAKALQTKPERILFNFSDTEYINTSGIAVLIKIVMQAEKTGHKIGLFGMSSHYQKVFELVRLPLYARALVVERAADRCVAIVSLDLLGLGDQAVGGMARFKKKVSAAADQAVSPTASFSVRPTRTPLRRRWAAPT